MFPIGTASELAGTSKRTVQAWMQRGKVSWLTKEHGERAEFTQIDVLRIALVVALVEHGMKVAEAAEVIGREVLFAELDDKAAPGLLKSKGLLKPQTVLVFVRRPVGWACNIVAKPNGSLLESIPNAAIILRPQPVLQATLDCIAQKSAKPKGKAA